MQVNDAAVVSGQAQQLGQMAWPWAPLGIVVIEGTPQAAPQQGQPPGQMDTGGGAPELQRGHGDGLELEAIRPGGPRVGHRLPGGLGTGPAQVQVTAQCPVALSPGCLQCPTDAVGDGSGGATPVLPEIGVQGTGDGATEVGELRPGEGLVQMAVGLHGGGEGQGEMWSCCAGQRFNAGDGCPVEGEGQIDKTIPVGIQTMTMGRIQQGQGPANLQRLGREQVSGLRRQPHCP